jgi:hypothetical protein
MDWKLHQITFQLRYPPNYLIWDCAGRLCEALQQSILELKVSEGSPSRVRLNSTESGLSVSFEPDSLVVRSGIEPKVKNAFESHCDIIANLALKEFKIKVLKRIGSRILFTKKFADQTTAQTKLQEFVSNSGFTINRFSNPDDSLKNKVPSEFQLRFTDDIGGISVHLHTTSFNSKFDPRYKNLFPEGPETNLYFIEADFDVYTKGPIDVEACSPRDVILNNVKMLETLFVPKLSIS